MKSISRLTGSAFRRSLRPVQSRTSHNCIVRKAPVMAAMQRSPAASTRPFHSSMPLKGLMPDAENPAPKQSEDIEQPTTPTDISIEEYNQRADEYLDELVSRLEAEQETRPDVDVEYSAGVLEVNLKDKGTYVLNKQPPNKQIWLSSPLSGPKRFDWVVTGEGLHQKEGGGVGDWIYLRDGTSLTDLVRKELGVELGIDNDATATK